MDIIKNLFFSGSLKSKTIKGITLMGGFKIFSRIISIIRIAILARILTPAHFGLFGIATITIAFLDRLTQTGINVVLIQEKKDIKNYISTAWITSIARGLLISLIVFISSKWVATFFNNSEATRLLRLISLIPLLRGFINPSIVKLQKELKFDIVIAIYGSVALVDALGAILFSLLTRSPIGLVYGMILGVLLEVLLSFILVKPIPTFDFNKKVFKNIIIRGKWITGAGIFNYLASQGDDAVVGKLLNANFLGLYQVAYKISMLPGTEITGAVSSVTFPVFTKISEDKKRMRRAYFKSLLPVVIIVLPLSAIIFLFPKQIIQLLLGDKWIGAVSALRVLIVFGLIVSINSTKNSVFLALNKQKMLFKLHVLRFFILAISIIPLTIQYGIVGAGFASLISVLFVTPIAFYYLYKYLN